MDEVGPALRRAAEIVAAYREGLPDARVTPIAGRADVRAALGALPDGPTPLGDVLSELVETATPGLMASSGPRYFGFVIGGSLDAALVADVITSGWEQNAFNEALSPAGIAFEDVAGTWLKEILGLPETASVGFATGGQGANTVGLAAGRWHVLNELGWDVGRDGLHGAPKLRVVVGEERHATIDRAVRLLGLGESAIVAVPALPDGAMDTTALARVLRDGDGPTIVCAQAGNVNTGACDDLARRRGGGAIGRSVGPRGRCLRTLGRRQPAHPVTRGGDRARRLVGLRRAQVAQRPVRLGLRVLRASGGARDRDGVHRRLPHRPGRGS